MIVAMSAAEDLGAFGQAADLFGDDGEPAAAVAGAGGFDGGVEGEQVGLVGDLVDQGQDGADLADPFGQGEGPFAGGADVELGLVQVVSGRG